ncbi:Hpt domain-containing protein [Vibrio sp. PP-XX7]
MMENESLLRQIAQMYLDGAEEKQTHLKAAIEQLERQAIRDRSHAIKGFAADIGADTVATIMAEIESVALDGEQSMLHQKYLQFEKCQEQVMHEMRLYLQN